MSVSSNNKLATAASRIRGEVLMSILPLLVDIRGEADYHANLEAARYCCGFGFRDLTVDDGFYAARFQQCDDAVFPVPIAVACAPHFVGFNLPATGQNDCRLTGALRSGSAGGDGSDAGGRV